MVKVTAQRVEYDTLKTSDYPAPVLVGSQCWFGWLTNHRSFHYECPDGKFTACKENRANGNFWYANRRVGGKLRRCYIGASQDLTLNKLIEVAKQLSDGNSYTKSHNTADKSSVNTTQSSNELEKLKVEIAQLKQVIAERDRQLQAAESRIKELETLPTRLLNEYINEHNLADKLPNSTRYRDVKELSRFKAWLENHA